ncbi:hypothetical protein FCH79_07090 [Pseudomonas koreensis]|nr:hypothetical protein [Pseudomonas koreensis]
MWRGSLLPLGCVAPPNLPNRFSLTDRMQRFCDCCAAEREQAPSPQGCVHVSRLGFGGSLPPDDSSC